MPVPRQLTLTPTRSQRIIEAKSKADSIGGTVTCVIRRSPVGLGEPVFDKLEAKLAHAMLSIPATKGFEIGSGFKGTEFAGSVHNDAFIKKPDGKLGTKTNRSGGVQGGISNGEDIYFKCVVELSFSRRCCSTARRPRADAASLPAGLPSSRRQRSRRSRRRPSTRARRASSRLVVATTPASSLGASLSRARQFRRPSLTLSGRSQCGAHRRGHGRSRHHGVRLPLSRSTPPPPAADAPPPRPLAAPSSSKTRAPSLRRSSLPSRRRSRRRWSSRTRRSRRRLSTTLSPRACSCARALVYHHLASLLRVPAVLEREKAALLVSPLRRLARPLAPLAPSWSAHLLPALRHRASRQTTLTLSPSSPSTPQRREPAVAVSPPHPSHSPRRATATTHTEGGAS